MNKARSVSSKKYIINGIKKSFFSITMPLMKSSLHAYKNEMIKHVYVEFKKRRFLFETEKKLFSRVIQPFLLCCRKILSCVCLSFLTRIIELVSIMTIFFQIYIGMFIKIFNIYWHFYYVHSVKFIYFGYNNYIFLYPFISYSLKFIFLFFYILKSLDKIQRIIVTWNTNQQ